MKCPDCGHDNIDGADACGNCEQDLRSIDIPVPKAGLQSRIMLTRLRDLNPAAALTVSPAAPIARAIRLMQENRQGSVLVVEGGRLVGIFTEHDALMRVAGRGLDLETRPVSDVMTRDPRALRDEDTLAFAMHWMAVGNHRHIPIVEEGRPLRFISVRGVLRYLHEKAR